MFVDKARMLECLARDGKRVAECSLAMPSEARRQFWTETFGTILKSIPVDEVVDLTQGVLSKSGVGSTRGEPG
jgi:hypothetical protein